MCKYVFPWAYSLDSLFVVEATHKAIETKYKTNLTYLMTVEFLETTTSMIRSRGPRVWE
jgi:hypothetical protein